MVVTTIRWPCEVDNALDLLVEAATADSPPASRARLLAALVVDVRSRIDAEFVDDLLASYGGTNLDSLPTTSRVDRRLGRPRG